MTTYRDYLLAQIDQANAKLAATARGLGETCQTIARRTEDRYRSTDRISSESAAIGELQTTIRVLCDALENFDAFAGLDRLK